MSAYGNPQPYADTSLERSALLGRLRVARGVAARARARGDIRQAGAWDAVCDELLDHLPEADARAITAGLEDR